MSYVILFLSVIIGFGVVSFIKPNQQFIRLLLAFSGAYLLSVTVIELLPKVYSNSENNFLTGILILSGILFQYILESLSKGAEHGHIHVNTESNQFPTLLFVSLCVHAFTEGMPIHDGENNLLWAIMIHKIPIAIVLSVFLLRSNLKKTSIGLFIVIFALMSPLGILAGNKVDVLVHYSNEVNALVTGIFLHISTVILFESTENHRFNLKKFIAILLGILLIVFSEVF